MEELRRTGRSECTRNDGVWARQEGLLINWLALFYQIKCPDWGKLARIYPIYPNYASLNSPHMGLTALVHGS